MHESYRPEPPEKLGMQRMETTPAIEHLAGASPHTVYKARRELFIRYPQAPLNHVQAVRRKLLERFPSLFDDEISVRTIGGQNGVHILVPQKLGVNVAGLEPYTPRLWERAARAVAERLAEQRRFGAGPAHRLAAAIQASL